MNNSTFSAFATVDLDAVLDDFESMEATRRQEVEVKEEVVAVAQADVQQQQDEEEEPQGKLKAKQRERETLFQERFTAANAITPVDKVNEGDPGAAQVGDLLMPEQEKLEDPVAAIVDELSMHELEEDEVLGVVDLTPDNLDSEIVVACSGDPGLQTSTEQVVSPRSDSTSSSPTFESIYDTARRFPEEEEVEPLPVATLVSMGGARPKESTSLASTGIPTSTAAKGASVPAESPPPYSEVDPMSSSVPSSALEQESTGLIAIETPAGPQLTPPTDIDALLSDLTEDQLVLGKVTPRWVPDAEAPSCMICDGKFTLVRRRHHCRACGKVLCSACCNDKVTLSCMGNKIARVCKPCRLILDRLHQAEATNGASGGSTPSSVSDLSPVMRSAGLHDSASAALPPPVGVLKRIGASGSASPSGEASAAAIGGSDTRVEAKQVMFSDGIRPGGDLAELDGSSEYGRSSGRRHRRSRKSHKSSADVGRSMIPPEEDALPLVWCGDSLRKTSPDALAQVISSGGDGGPLVFQINKNLRVFVALINYSPISQQLWSYRSDGLTSVGQDEIVLLLLRLPEESLLHKDIFEHFQSVYEQARAGHPAIDMSYTSILSGKPFLGSTDYGGFLYIRHTFQSLEGLDLPPQPPFLFALLLTKWEVPWARVFPLRLKLRLGAEMRYYPAPLWSVRKRKTVYKDIGNTIMKLLCDFKNYAYSLPIIRGLQIQMELKLTTILVPKDRYRQIERALLNSNEPVLALGASFSTSADSHLVAVQNDDESSSQNGGGVSYSDYETQAINILNKTRKVTGASFVIFNGALKASSGLSAKSSIVEDGIMVQVTPEKMTEIRKALEKMEDFQIKCGPLGSEDSPDEIVALKWVDKNSSLNSGVRSLIDDRCLDSVSSIRLHAGRDYVSDEASLFIRWTEVFLLANPSETLEFDPPDPMVAATALAKAICAALVPHLKVLRESQVAKLAVRITLDHEKAGYETGIHGQQFGTDVMNALDSVLVPIIHGDTSSHKLCLELIFHILEL